MNISQESLDRARRELSVLVGKPLTDMWRYAGFQRFEFGEQRPFINRKGKPSRRSDWALVATNWEITQKRGFVLNASHFGPDGARRDQHAKAFYNRQKTDPYVVVSLNLLEDGEILIKLTRSYQLRVFRDPMIGPADWDVDEWRYRDGTGDDSLHVVLQKYTGFYFSEDDPDEAPSAT